MKTSVATIIFLFLFTSSAFAVCPSISQTKKDARKEKSTVIGNSFTATCSGRIESIAIDIYSGEMTNGTLKIYTTDGVTLDELKYTQDSINLSTGPQTITLTTPLDITSDTQYAFIIECSSEYYLLGSDTNPYSGGKCYFTSKFLDYCDLYFIITFTSGGGADNTPIVPLYGYMGFGMLLLGSGIYVLRRRRS